MPWSIDARIPLVMVPDEAELAAALAGGRPAALLMEAPPVEKPAGAVALASFDMSGPVHAASCTCCVSRGPAALALDRLFQARVHGGCGWFERVVALVENDAARAEVGAALRDDALTAARFRVG